MYIVKNGYLICPTCKQNKQLLLITEQTQATSLPVYCRRCKTRHIVDINQGACFQSQGQ